MTSNMIQSDFVVVKETATLNWTINNVGSLLMNKVSNSQYFSTSSSSSENDCKFRMHFKFVHENSKYIIKIYLSSSKKDVQIQCRISIVDDSGEKQHTKEYRLICGEGDDNCTESIDYVTYRECANTTRSNNLRIYCEVDVLERRKFSPNQALVEKSFLEGMRDLLENGDFSDVVLVVGDKEFNVHKNILSARSDVFKAMFLTDFEEKKRNRVEITDLSVEAFEQLLLYIYTDTIPELSEHTVDLFIAADKYNLPYLKATCEQQLENTKPEIDSAAHILLLADMHSAEQLKKKYMKFIVDNLADVRKTEGWKHLAKARVDLVLKLDIGEFVKGPNL